MESKSDSAALESYEMDEEISAKERLNPHEDELASPSKVKFTSASTDGQLKIDVNAAYPTSVGMSKEELKQYANDPFWVRLRLFLFVLFWVMWFAILIGAIVIIAVTPKCDQTATIDGNASNMTANNSSEVFATSAGIALSDLTTTTLTSVLVGGESTPNQ